MLFESDPRGQEVWGARALWDTCTGYCSSHQRERCGGVTELTARQEG